MGATSIPNNASPHSTHKHFYIGLLLSLAQYGAAYASVPDAKNNLPIRPNPTATMTGVCYKLDKKGYSQIIHASCYSERKQAVVVLVSGKVKGMSGQLIAEHIIGKFQKPYVPAVAFLDMPDWDGVTISFILNGDAGPYSGNNWQEGLEILKLHSAQAWHKN